MGTYVLFYLVSAGTLLVIQPSRTEETVILFGSLMCIVCSSVLCDTWEQMPFGHKRTVFFHIQLAHLFDEAHQCTLIFRKDPNPLVIAILELTEHNERLKAVSQALLEHSNAPNAPIAILKGMYPFKENVHASDIPIILGRLCLIRCEQPTDLIIDVFRVGGSCAANFVGLLLPIPNSDIVIDHIIGGSALQYTVVFL